MTLDIGIELELLVKPKPQFASEIPGFLLKDPASMTPHEIRDNRMRLYSHLAAYITEHSERIIVDSDDIEYETWVLSSDASIEEARPFNGFCEPKSLLLAVLGEICGPLLTFLAKIR